MALADHSLTQIEIAARCGIGHSEISRILSGKRPGDALFPKLCATETWGDSRTALQILCAALRDEIERAGRSTEEVLVSIAGDAPDSRTVHSDLAVIAEWLPNNPEVLPMLRHIAAAARRDLSPEAPPTPPTKTRRPPKAPTRKPHPPQHP